MAKTIDLSKKLDNSRPFIKVAEGKIYEVDNRKNTVLLLDQKMAAAGQGDLKAISEIITTMLGEKAAQEIEEMDLSLGCYQKIIIAIFALVGDETFEVAEARFLKERSRLDK